MIWCISRQATIRQLDMDKPQIAFAGGLLESQNLLSSQVLEKLNLPKHPQAKYPPMVGAALLAQITCEKTRNI
ncbi:MAG: hypothetical protein Q9P01_13655 [Anaerolineae bacterium]|nr:hypothetical protein [Anaerolineae bacterium]